MSNTFIFLTPHTIPKKKEDEEEEEEGTLFMHITSFSLF